MVRKISDDFLTRLEENRRLSEQPGLGRVGGRFWSNLGLYAFWWLAGLAVLMTWGWLQIPEHNRINSWLFGWLY